MEIRNCKRCNLAINRKNIVNGTGAMNKIMFIGEAPGYYEDKVGVPFIGNSGKQLEEFMKACNFTRANNYYITNIVKCRPNKNNVPDKYSIAACMPYLIKEIQEVKPKIIVLLGSTALQTAFSNPTLRITQWRGRWLGRNSNIIATYHPSYLLQNVDRNDLFEDVVNDFMTIVDKYRLTIDFNHITKY